MALENILERNLISCAPTASVKEVARLMDDNNVGAVVVVEADKLCGIITDRDIVLRCVARNGRIEDTFADDIMTRDVRTAHLEDGLFDVIRAMKDYEVRRVPIVDSDGRCAGLISFGDVFELLGKEMGDLGQVIAPDNPKIVSQAA